MQLEIFGSDRHTITLADAVAAAQRCPTCPPFHESVLCVCDLLSRGILSDPEAKRFPELLVLAYWIRKAEIQRLQAEFMALSRVDRILMPRGTIFHLPPSNVDTIFIYSWIFAALTGNRNVIRISRIRSPQTNVLLRLLSHALAAAPEPARRSTLLVSYGHEPEPTAAFTALSDVRVIWGGDATVETIRRESPLPPHAREITFPDRCSFAALHGPAYLALSTSLRDQLADRFFNDAFWFDQLACSSPRLVVWCGPAAEARAASTDFFPRVSACAHRRHYPLTAANSMQKLRFASEAVLARSVYAYRQWPELTVLSLASLADFDRTHPGGGLFFEADLPALSDLAATVLRRDQTLAVFGFAEAELRGLATALNGRGLDRFVPIGQALQFGRFWDGHDLLQEFCRHVYLDPLPARTVGER